MTFRKLPAPGIGHFSLAVLIAFFSASASLAQEDQGGDQSGDQGGEQGETQAPTEQVGPTIGARIESIQSALAAVVSHADSGAWQSADEAFNGFLDALDLNRAQLIVDLPSSAPAAFAEIDVLLIDLDGALTAEDPIRIRAINGLVESHLARLAPIARSDASASPAADVVLAWRDSAARIEGLAAASLWRDMRNEAIALIDDIERRSGIVHAALGDERALDLERIGVFALRLRAAALDQSAAETARASAHFGRAVDQLMQGLGLVAAPTPKPADQSLARFRGFQVEGALGDSVIVPIKAEGVPRIGLGAFALRALWSPAALSFVEVRPGEGSPGLRSESSAGRVDMSLPQAPLGPGGDAIVASLVFEIVGDATDAQARDYLPRDVVDSVEAAVSESVSLVKLGDLPKAAAEVSRAHDSFVGGRDLPGSAWSRLEAGQGQGQGSESIERRFLTILALLSRPEPAPTDEIVVALALLQSEFGQAIERHLERISQEGAIPILIDAVEAKDASGVAMFMRESIPGQVMLAASSNVDADQIPTPAVDARSLQEMDLGLVTPPPLDELESSFNNEADPVSEGQPSGPTALLFAMGFAAIVAALAAAMMARAGPRPADD